MQRSAVLRYGLLGLPLAFGALPIYLFVPDFYSRSALLNLTMLGWILLGTRLADAIADPLFGWLIDRVSKPRFLTMALIPFALGFIALFHPHADVDPALWLVGSLLACTLGFSAAMIAYQSWGGDLGEYTHVRLRLTGAREGFGLIGVVLASVLPSLLSEDPLQGLKLSVWVFMPLLAVAAWVTLRLRTKWIAPATAASGFWKSLGEVLGDRVYRRLVGVFVANGIASAFPATLFVFFVADVLGAQPMTGMLLGLYFLSAALGVPLWVHLSSSIGRPKAWLWAMLLAIMAFAGAASLGAGDWPLFALVCVGSGLAMGADLTIPASLVADLGEGKGRTASYFGIWNLIAKFNLALAAGVALPLLGWFDYAPGQGGNPQVLVMTYVLLPLSLKLCAMVLLWRWREPLAFKN